MKCINPDCKQEISDGSKFCNHCGTKIETKNITCPNCGNDKLPEHAVFCNGCGFKLQEERKEKEQTRNCPLSSCGRTGISVDFVFCPDCGCKLSKNYEPDRPAIQDTEVTSNKWPDYGVPWNPLVSYDTFTDPRDGHCYRTVKIGSQIWMAENLSFNLQGSLVYNNNIALEAKYGRFYKIDKAIQACPPGWHLPTRSEWEGLLQFVGSSQAGKMLKASKGWKPVSIAGGYFKLFSVTTVGNGTDDYGFRALPAGHIGFNNISGLLETLTSFWAFSENGERSRIDLSSESDNWNNNEGWDGSLHGDFSSIRCLKS